MLTLPFRGLKTGILAALVILIVSAMLLVDLLLVKWSQESLSMERVKTGRLLLAAVSEMFKALEERKAASDFPLALDRMLSTSGFSSALVSESDGTSHIIVGDWGEALEDARSSALEALATSGTVWRFSGTSWGVTWFAPQRVLMSAVLHKGGGQKIAVTVGADLMPIYKELRRGQYRFLPLIGLYACILILLGMYLFSKTVVAPVRRLLSMAAGLEETTSAASIPPPGNNELGRLFLAVRDILSHLEKNKARLQEHIASLEKANEELKKAQDEMLRSEKLAATGRLAAGIAHEIGNPLGIISGYLELLRSGGLTKEEESDLLGRIDSEAGRIGKIIRQMLDLARPSIPRSEPLSINDVIAETLSFLENQPWLSCIEIKTSLEARPDMVLGDRERLREVFINIIMNAADAMEGGGTITIETLRDGDLIRTAVTDTGPGIPPEHLISVFDPFFTTKEPGRGTGLGLWVCYRTITDMGGRIEALRPEKGGARIEITLEAVREGKEPSEAGHQREEART
jgi:signal transduction histidine kinase